MSSETVRTTVRGTRDSLVGLFELTALWPEGGDGPEFRETLVRVDERGVENPVGSLPGSPTSYCTFGRDYFETVDAADEEVSALLDVERVVDALRWVDDPVALKLCGPPDATLVPRVVVAGPSLSVDLRCRSDPGLLEEVSLDAPDWFDADERFTAREVAATVETTADELVTLATAAERSGETVPVVVEDGAFRVRVDADERAFRGDLPATVTGGPITKRYGAAFGAVARTLDGEVTLQVALDGTLAVVGQHGTHTTRYLLDSVE